MGLKSTREPDLSGSFEFRPFPCANAFGKRRCDMSRVQRSNSPTNDFARPLQVQAFIACIFEQCQRHHCNSLLAGPRQTSGPRLGKMHLEWDETSELQRVRFGQISTDAIFSVLAPCLWD